MKFKIGDRVLWLKANSKVWKINSYCEVRNLYFINDGSTSYDRMALESELVLYQKHGLDNTDQEFLDSLGYMNNAKDQLDSRSGNAADALDKGRLIHRHLEKYIYPVFSPIKLDKQAGQKQADAIRNMQLGKQEKSKSRCPFVDAFDKEISGLWKEYDENARKQLYGIPDFRKCKCDIHELMRSGCLCGGFQNESENK